MRGGEKKLEGLTIIGKKVQSRLDSMQESREWLAAQIGISDAGLAKWMKGNTAKPRGFASMEDAWKSVATVLKVSPEILLDNTKPLALSQQTTRMKGLVTFPEGGFLGTFRIPMPDLEVELPRWPPLPANEKWDLDPQDWIEYESVPNIFGRRNAQAPHRIVAPVVGRSMEPRLYEGDLAVIELDSSPRTGRIVLAKSCDGLLTLKVLERDRTNQYRLKSINPDHGEAKAEAFEQVGFLIGVIRDYRSGRGLVEWDFGGMGP